MTVIWDERLITRHRAADMAGTWDLKIDTRFGGSESEPFWAYLRCGQCDGNITMLPGNGKTLNVDGIISLVVGHMVRNHGHKLSGSGYGTDSAAPDAARINRSNRSAGDPVH